MLYARLADGTKGSPTGKGQRAVCPNCDDHVIGKFGQLVIPHWAHPTNRECDPWSEPEGPWHLAWKALVKPEQVEVTMKRVVDGVLHHHRADIVNARGVVVELQHSAISPETIQAREAFYKNMVWVFDASNLVGAGRWQIIEVCDDQPKCQTEDGQIEAWRSSEKAKWLHFKRSLTTITKPLYLDFGCPVNSEWDHIGSIWDLVQTPIGPSMLRVSAIQEGGIIVGRFIDKRRFLCACLRESLADKDLTNDAMKWARRSASHIHNFRKVRTRKRLEERLEAEQEAEAQQLEAERLAKARRLKEIAEEKDHKGFLRRIERFDYNQLIQYLRKASRTEFDYREKCALEERKRDFEKKMWANLLQVGATTFAEIKKVVLTQHKQAEEQAAKDVKPKKWTVSQHRGLTSVMGPFDEDLIAWVKEQRFRWNSQNKRWESLRAYNPEELQKELDLRSMKHEQNALWVRTVRTLKPKVWFIYRALNWAEYFRSTGEIEEPLPRLNSCPPTLKGTSL